mgnify:CR=1 FL=1
MEVNEISNEKEILSQSQNPEENTTIQKTKVDWTFLNDIESLITQMEEGKKVRCIVFDTETTGLNHKKDHILELAAVEVENFKLTSRVIHFYIKPRVFVPKNVQELNHIKYDDYKNFWEYYNQDTKSQLEHLLNFIGNDAYLIAHNATFDYYFLMSELKYWGLPEIPKERFRCTLRITKKLFKEKGIETANYKLITLCDYFKILVNPNEGSFHNGLFDTIMTSKLLIHLYKNFANINDYIVPHKYDNKEKKEKKENKINEEEIKDKINNININTDKKTDVNKIENNNEVKNNEIKGNENNINNNVPDGNELNLLIKKMNEMIINENSKEKKDEDKKEQ